MHMDHVLATLLSFLVVSGGVSCSLDTEIVVNLDKTVWIVSDKFLSVTIDAGSIQTKKWDTINFTSAKVLNLARALSPAMLRIGGTAQDSLIFESLTKNSWSKAVEQLKPYRHEPFNMTSVVWDRINQFSSDADWSLIFGLNALLRNSSTGSWDSTNAQELLQYTLSKGYSVDWELGNEPDLFPLKDGEALTSRQLAEDFEALQKLVNNLKLKTRLVGPDVSTLVLWDFFRKFLSNMKPGVLSATTWHRYYTNGATAVLPDMYSTFMLDKFIVEAALASESVNEFVPGTELWLGETSSCYGGGAPMLSDSFVSGFMWLDKLGIAARSNTSRVFRQEFFGGSYGLLDNDLNPLPDYWLSVLYKHLVGDRVLNVSNGLNMGQQVRVYAHCAQQPLYSSGDVVLLILNIQTHNATATIKSVPLATAQRDVYWLSPAGNTTNILSKNVALNGKALTLVNGTTLPHLSPATQEPGKTIMLPALTFGFYVFKNTKAKAC